MYSSFSMFISDLTITGFIIFSFTGIVEFKVTPFTSVPYIYSVSSPILFILASSSALSISSFALKLIYLPSLFSTTS